MTDKYEGLSQDYIRLLELAKDPNSFNFFPLKGEIMTKEEDENPYYLPYPRLDTAVIPHIKGKHSAFLNEIVDKANKEGIDPMEAMRIVAVECNK